ncbi:ABC transporter family substrate-binding protein [Pseudonocardia acidicola]|uniref:ABC transporter family substrate-binding protein n=1 Tax=Pseudonocardia acidicola TaxID=2724939 RepID=A0ABX1SKN3_9PSEU|nr:ABC transporter family substrate-binding protein [Pseudonocardia acidicola]NMI02130.1 ABC transporter family substrate-binding protein [Pseudonocardia acidicola]
MSRTRLWSTAAVAATAALVLAACGGGGGGGGGTGSGGFADCATSPNTCNSVPADQLQQGGQITYAIEKNIQNWNVNSSEGNVFETGLVTKALLPYVFYTAPDLKSTLNTDVMVSADMVNPTTAVYKIKPDAVWDDGTPVTADDFIFNWKTQDTRDCPACETAGNGGYDQVTSVVGSDGGKTVTATFAKPYTDWQSVFNSASPLYPAHIAAQHGDLNTPAGLKTAFDYFNTTVPNYSAGPYKVQSWQDNVALTVVPNPKWYGATKPKLDRLVFRVITDATQEPIALQNNEVQVIYPQPQVDIVQQVQQIPGVSQTQGLGLQWEHYDFNLKNPFLADKALRQAMFTAVNRDDVIAKTVGQFNKDVKPLDSHMFMPQQQGYQDNIAATGQGSGNLDAAKKILTDAGYKGVGTALVAPNGQAVPTFRIRYTVGNAIRQSECELFAQYVKGLGINVQVQPTDSLGTTASTGDFDIIVFAWVQSPFPFGGAQQLWLSTSGSNYGKYNNPQVDQLINQAASSTDVAAATQQLNQADKIMSEDAYVLPLYQKPTFIAIRDNVANVRNNSSLDGPLYNVSQWGLKSGS